MVKEDFVDDDSREPSSKEGLADTVGNILAAGGNGDVRDRIHSGLSGEPKPEFTQAPPRHRPSRSPFAEPPVKKEGPFSLEPLDLTRSTPSTATTNTTNFNSNFLNQEYLMLGDLILKPSLPSLLPIDPGDFDPGDTSDPMAPLMASFDHENSRPFIALSGVGAGSDNDEDINNLNGNERSYMNVPGSAGSNRFPHHGTANPSSYTADARSPYVSPLVSHHIYQTVQDIYANKVINFDYPQSYHSLTHFLKRRFSIAGKLLSPDEAAHKKKNLLIILKLIASYRPTFISAHKSLFRPFDFHFLEMSFQRCLLDYENLSRLNALPTIIWRRTGEIVSISNDLVNLLGLSVSEVLSKRTFIMELMFDDDSIVDYFRLFKSVAVGNLRSTIVTRCKLIKRTNNQNFATTNTRLGELDYIDFCSAWTVKRDLFDIPMMIVGQFLPMLITA